LSVKSQNLFIVINGKYNVFKDYWITTNIIVFDKTNSKLIEPYALIENYKLTD